MSHRGKHPNDDHNFSEKHLPALREAVADLSFLLDRGYSETSALELVGNRYFLNARQRLALMRMSVGATRAQERQAKALSAADMQGQSLVLDGYNILILTEVALSGGYIFEGMDGCYRDIASIHGTYRSVEETIPALQLIGKGLQALGIEHAHWFFDAPISNSGRLKTRMRELAEQEGYPWEISLVNNPDKEIAALQQVAATSDGWIIDQLPQWFNFTRWLFAGSLFAGSLIRLFAGSLRLFLVI